MKKILILLILCSILCAGCNNTNNKLNNKSEETYIISGIITEKSGIYSNYLTIKVNDGTKFCVYENKHSLFCVGLQEGDRVTFEVRLNGNAYEIIRDGFNEVNK